MNFLFGLDAYNEDMRIHGESPLALAIGMFDGVHLGHQAVIDFTREKTRLLGPQGKCAAFTFDRQPASVFRPESAPKLIYPLAKKIECLKATGIDYVFVIEFNAELCKLTARQFIEHLAETFPSLKEICVGRDFGFGHRREGNIDVLRQLAPEFGYSAYEVRPFQSDHENVSSTLIRQKLSEGDLFRARELIGRELTVSGPIIKGRQVGRQIGFPTANIDVHGLCLPPNGVYLGVAHIENQPNKFPAIMNIGSRPTVESHSPGQILAEIHIPHFNQDIYNQHLEFSIKEFLRPEMKFESVDALKAQISHDCEKVGALTLDG